MSIERSYGRIEWRNNILGFHMVNPEGQQFFIYAEQLLSVCKKNGEPVRIKRRDLNPNIRAAHHLGEIYGSLSSITSSDTLYICITLHFSSADRLIEFNQDRTELLEVIEEQDYTFPKAEWLNFTKSIKAMQSQHPQYTLLMQNCEVLN